jgi:hypothetical protein
MELESCVFLKASFFLLVDFMEFAEGVRVTGGIEE